MEKLAIDGGRPVRTKPAITEQNVFEEEELQALIQIAKQKKLRRAQAAVVDAAVSCKPTGDSILSYAVSSENFPKDERDVIAANVLGCSHQGS